MIVPRAMNDSGHYNPKAGNKPNGSKSRELNQKPMHSMQFPNNLLKNRRCGE
jgi:hypothetical protein